MSAALPVVSAGFFSKEMILGEVWSSPSPILWAAGITGALLTAIYIFRAVFLVFFGSAVTEPSGTYGIRILLPLALLAIGAISIGWLETPGFLGGRNMFAGFLQPSTGATPRHAVLPLITLAGCIAPLAGISIAWGLHRSGYWRAQAGKAPGRWAAFLRGGSGFDAFYDVLLVQPYLWLVSALRHDPVDLVSTGLERAAIALHRRLRATQNGKLRRYAAWLMAGSIATIAMVLFA